MTNLELIEKHDEGTKYCSFQHHMRTASPTYAQIIEKGKDIVPDILKYLRDNEGGMSIMLLLWDILKISPYTPELKDGFFAVKVGDSRRAWIAWGIKEKLL